MSSLPIEHLSASSLTTFLRCPRQWQENYIYGARGQVGSALIVGSYVHEVIADELVGVSPIREYIWEDIFDEYNPEDIIWKEKPETAKSWGDKQIDTYLGYMDNGVPVATEQEIEIDIGADIPLLGYVDIVYEDHIRDIKTTGYFNRRVEINPEWKLQMAIYQMEHSLPGYFDVLTRSAKDPLVIVPMGMSDPDQTKRFCLDTYKVMRFYWDEFGENPWPGNVTHPWAGKYCPVGNCCCK